MAEKSAPTYDGEALAVLVWEFNSEDRSEADRKIRRRLRRKKLGVFDPARIEILRALKNQLQAELGRFEKSVYWLGSHGRYADYSDFDLERLLHDLEKNYPQVARDEIQGLINFGVYLYYLK